MGFSHCRGHLMTEGQDLSYPRLPRATGPTHFAPGRLVGDDLRPPPLVISSCENR
jgi:hypothetical protein